MEKERRDTLMAATYGLKEISHFCIEMGFDFKRLIEFTEDERSLKIIKELMKKHAKYLSIVLPLARYVKQWQTESQTLKVFRKR